ncbi:MAG TPA: hypothetical protein VEA80_03885 [Vitreimonas sp.]|uniref:hypothetical protein n=1 Tax=Vitreimonas sp. TaxID=3069702 RepID=UPI002D656F27|nr:hypothetical protein [Vitreimonas sp.]HYD86590.1 hypothetical protein [Vitreimonas sp.]
MRTALLAGAVIAASAVGVTLAGAQEAAQPALLVNLMDPEADLPEGAALNLSVRDDNSQPISPIGPTQGDGDRRGVELELAAGGGDSPLDVSIAQRASIGANADGDIDRRGRGSELRVGRGLVGERDSGNRGSSTYVFVASEDEALTWQPGSRNEFGGQGASFALQDQVEVGDLAAGVTWERNGVQTSLAYVEREESTRVGNQTYSQDESFTGVTVTMRR